MASASQKGVKAEMLCTPLDVRLLNKAIIAGDNGVGEDPLIEHYILLADGFIRDSLRPVYGANLNSLLSAAWASTPIIPPVYDGQAENTNLTGIYGSRGLLAVSVDADAITEYWTIVFSSATAWTLFGSVSDNQSGVSGFTDISSDHTATDGDVTIPTNGWSGTPVSGDIVYFATYNVPQLVVQLSAKWAASLIMEAKYSEEVPNLSDYVTAYRDSVLDTIDKLSRPDDLDGIHIVGVPVRDVSPIEGLPEYTIDQYGTDQSDYEDDQYR